MKVTHGTTKKIIEDDSIVVKGSREEEIQALIQDLKNNKSPGESEILGEMRKTRGKQL